MAALNKILVLGNLGATPELSHTRSGKPVTTLSVATNEYFKDQLGGRQERTTWLRVTAWDKLAVACCDSLTKGRQILVEGKLRNRKWKDSSGTERVGLEIHATSIQFLGRRPASEDVDTSVDHGLDIDGLEEVAY